MGKILLPPGCGALLGEPLLFNPYQDAFQKARRQRVCMAPLATGKLCMTLGSMSENGQFTCAKCQTAHWNNLTAPRAYDHLGVLAGRGGGKTLIGAHAVREELMIPNAHWWVMGPTYKVLHDSTFPTLVGLLNPEWIAKWDPEHTEIRLKNGALVAFRSLEDPERARGPHGLSGGWFDEAAQCPERAVDVFEPTLIRANGILIATTTVLGYDWTYEKIEKRAHVERAPGYWFTRYWTEENPLFQQNPTMMRKVNQARATMTPEFFAQEYKADRRNAEGLIYNFELIEKQTLLNDEEIRKIIPEWPAISPMRKIIVGLDSGADHPFGAVKLVVTERGLVVVGDYLERGRAISQHLDPIVRDLGVAGRPEVQWAANKNEANLRLEFGLRGVGVIPAENKHEIGIQRVQSWLYSRQLFFAYTAPRTIEQMRAYRMADNLKPSGEKKAREEVFKLKDELPDALRYAIMAWPELPDPSEKVMTDAQQARWDALPDQAKLDIERMREYHKHESRQSEELAETEAGYPLGGFFGGDDSESFSEELFGFGGAE